MTNWYVRDRGRTMGPFTTEQLLHMRSLNQVLGYQEVSQDRNSWQCVDLVPQLTPRAPLPMPTSAPSAPPTARSTNRSYRLVVGISLVIFVLAVASAVILLTRSGQSKIDEKPPVVPVNPEPPPRPIIVTPPTAPRITLPPTPDPEKIREREAMRRQMDALQTKIRELNDQILVADAALALARSVYENSEPGSFQRGAAEFAFLAAKRKLEELKAALSSAEFELETIRKRYTRLFD